MGYFLLSGRQKQKAPKGSFFVSEELEREKGIEPSLFAWEAKVLPLNDSRVTLIVPSAGLLGQRPSRACWDGGLSLAHFWMSPMHRYLIST